MGKNCGAENPCEGYLIQLLEGIDHRRVMGSNPLVVIALIPCGDMKNWTSNRAASGLFAPTTTPAENTVTRCTSAGSGPT
jgi:hypothetical protein